jgi:ATP adenylyltransferase
VERLWAPWRVQYIKADEPEGCFFCTKARENDDERNHVIWRGRSAFVLLNTYPYNNGHLMVAPHEHVAELEALDPEVLAEVMGLCQDAIRVLKQEFNPQGINLGANLGAAAGAGVKDHLHLHLVPRWLGDTNFMPVMADVRVIPQSLDSAYRLLRHGFERLKETDGA